MKSPLRPIVAGVICLFAVASVRADETDDSLKKAVTFYVSFDTDLRADFGKGGLKVSTRYTVDAKRNRYERKPGFPRKAFRIAKDRGISGGALEATDVLPRSGRISFPAKGNVAYRKTGWSGAASLWINTNPNTMLKTKYCDPLQITERGATNGGIWCDFTPDKPRDFRLGAFPAVKAGAKPLPSSGPKAPVVRVKGVGFRSGDWHHVVLSWKNLDTGKPNAEASLYIDGKLIGVVKDREIGMKWDVDKAGVYVAVNYIGLLDELALFHRALTAEEVRRLHRNPRLLASLKSASK
jgi:hypothetical protein